jgi:hypothetical protein
MNFSEDQCWGLSARHVRDGSWGGLAVDRAHFQLFDVLCLSVAIGCLILLAEGQYQYVSATMTITAEGEESVPTTRRAALYQH